jgi:hypothetical protein
MSNAEDTRARLQAAHDRVCGGTDDVDPHVIADALAGPGLDVRTVAEWTRFQFRHALDARGLDVDDDALECVTGVGLVALLIGIYLDLRE